MDSRIISLLVLFSLTLLFVGCVQTQNTENNGSVQITAGNETQNTTAGAVGENVVVHIQNFAFNPSDLTITAGESVTWINDDSVTHDILSNGNFDSGLLASGKNFTFTFDMPGEFDYICKIHPSMNGKITVN